MQKLIITVTVDSTMSYPGNPNMPPIEDVDMVAREYIDAVAAGASIVHLSRNSLSGRRNPGRRAQALQDRLRRMARAHREDPGLV